MPYRPLNPNPTRVRLASRPLVRNTADAAGELSWRESKLQACVRLPRLLWHSISTSSSPVKQNHLMPDLVSALSDSIVEFNSRVLTIPSIPDAGLIHSYRWLVWGNWL
jgi:hypothetical protein